LYPRGLVQLPRGELVGGQPDRGPVDALGEDAAEEVVDEILVDPFRVCLPWQEQLGRGFLRRGEDLVDEPCDLDDRPEDLPDDRDRRYCANGDVEGDIDEGFCELGRVGRLREGDLGEQAGRAVLPDPGDLWQHFGKEIPDDRRFGEVDESQPITPCEGLLLRQESLAERH
jgi:hypothetical protein